MCIRDRANPDNILDDQIIFFALSKLFDRLVRLFDDEMCIRDRWYLAKRAELENTVVAANPRMPGKDDMRTNPGVITDLDILTDDRIRADRDAGTEPRARVDDCAGVNHVCTQSQVPAIMPRRVWHT